MSLLLYSKSLPTRTPLDLDEYILAAEERGELDAYLVVVPTHRKLREMERELTSTHHRRTGRPLSRLPLHTMGSLATDLFERIAPGRREATTEIQIALMERAMKNVDLGYFSQQGRDPSLGVVESVTRVISGVRADGILPSNFADDIERAESGDPGAQGYDLPKLRDLYNIYAEYLRILGDTWIDHPGRMLRVNTALFHDRDALVRAAFPGVTTLLVHNHTEFTWPEIDMLIALGQVTDLNVLIVFDYEEGNGPLYGNFEEVIAKLITGGYATSTLDPIDPSVPESERRPFTHHMRRNLFRTDQRIENSSFDNRIGVLSFRTREEEARGIAGLVKSLVLENGIAPERICIATLSMEPYTELFREHFAAYGIPANITSRYRLERNGLVTALFSALMIVASNYDRRDVLRAVGSPYLSFGAEVDPAALAEASATLRITRGYQAWRRRIGRRVEYLSSRIRTSVDPDERRSIEVELGTLRRAETSIESIQSFLSPFAARMTPTAFRGAFMRLISSLCVTENVLHLRRALDARPRTPADWQRVHDEMERDTRALARFLALLDELTELFELDAAAEIAQRRETAAQNEAAGIVDASAADPDDPILHPLSYYLDHVRTAAARSFYGLREKHDFGLLVTTLDQLTGLSYDIVIMCGMVDGEFPSTYITANFLGKPLKASEERHLRRERVAFYTGLTSFRERLLLTYPRTEGENENVRSSFLDALLRITTAEQSGRVEEYKELHIEREERRRRKPFDPERDFPAMISSLEELSEEGGKMLWNGHELPRLEMGGEMIENLRHTVAVEIGRRDAEEDETLVPEYRGVITGALDPAERATLGERREREYSSSQLETYAACPFKFFTQRILTVHSSAEYDVTLTPLERGVLVHTILFRLYTELRERNELPIAPERRDEIIERARAITREEIEGIALEHPYWTIDKERLLGSEALNGLIEQWIDSEATRSDGKSRLVPEFFEVAFGTGGGVGGSSDTVLSASKEIEIYDVKVRGKVDRVEIVRDGDIVYYAVADYKTGQPPKRGDIEKGLKLQILIYLEVIRHVLAEHFALPLENIRPVGGIYYQLNARKVEARDSYLFVPNEMKKDIVQLRQNKRDPATVEDLTDLLEKAFAHAHDYVEGIAEGVFHVTPHDATKICRGCEYHSVCRVWEVGRPERGSIKKLK